MNGVADEIFQVSGFRISDLRRGLCDRIASTNFD
jgi:hypothetical protein